MAMQARAPGQSKGADRAGRVAALLTFLAVMGVAVVVAIAAQRMINRQIEARVVTSSDALIASIEEGMQDVEQHLSSLTGLFEASDEVNAYEFRKFITEVGLAPGMNGIGYAPILTRDQRVAHEAAMAQRFEGYEVFERGADGARRSAGARDVYFPLQFFEPGELADRYLGFDVGSPQGHTSYVMRAIASGEATATPLTRLAVPNEIGFAVFHPVVGVSGTVEAVVTTELVLEDVMEHWVPYGMANVLAWTVRDVTELATGADLRAGGPGVHSGVLPASGRGVVHSDTVDVGGRIWQVDTVPVARSPLIDDRDRWQWILLTGMAMAVLAAAAVYSFERRSAAAREIEMLADAINTKNQFIAAVAHKLGTPLTGVLGFSEMLREEGSDMTPAERRELIEALADEAETLAAIHDDLIVLGRVEHGVLQLEEVRVDVEREVHEVLETLGLDGQVPVNVEGCPSRALVDPGRLHQILRNLISNALRYGGEHVEIVVSEHDDAVAVSVLDDGDGIPPECCAGLFHPHLPPSDTGTRNPQEAALGLSVSKVLAERMGGDLSYRRIDGTTIFDLTLRVTGTRNGDAPPREPGSAAVPLQDATASR